ncbi:hypothetical protein ANCCAN_23905 [Ancylostoma caninum]|uniref:Uncharacterized protein n=1 Tax=Ancylostoma caninum TaxID=29170 RepID=A0A368FE29_ANCCA|nr:hypothetical protein ANCCAN_23905 [Ancylostoma caninum]
MIFRTHLAFIVNSLCRSREFDVGKDRFDRHRFAVYTTPRPRTPVEGPSGPSIDVSIDFTRPDGQRTRPLLVENKRLYVDEHYISVWSPVLRYDSDIIAAKSIANTSF